LAIQLLYSVDSDAESSATCGENWWKLTKWTNSEMSSR